jgi:N-acyl-D-aspartate/D-glutamate deacylase
VGAALKPPDYKGILVYDHVLPPHRSVAEIAAERGCHPVEAMIDLALEADLHLLFLQFYGVNPETDIETILRHPSTAATFSDAGAHVSQICDFSLQTYLLAYWVRERGAITLEAAVRNMTMVPAMLWGFPDRGVIAPGRLADLNVIDPATIAPRVPTVRADLPSGAVRLHQDADGIAATVVSGVVTVRDRQFTGALPGTLLRRG